MTYREFANKMLNTIFGEAANQALVRVHIGNQLYDVKDIDTVIDMNTNKPNIVIHVDDK